METFIRVTSSNNADLLLNVRHIASIEVFKSVDPDPEPDEVTVNTRIIMDNNKQFYLIDDFESVASSIDCTLER